MRLLKHRYTDCSMFKNAIKRVQKRTRSHFVEREHFRRIQCLLPCFLNVSKCHTHETFLYMTLHGNTEKRLKSPKKHESLYNFCINCIVLTFVMKHMTSHQFPQKTYQSAYLECPLACDQIVVSSCSVASATASSPSVWILLFIVVPSCFQIT